MPSTDRRAAAHLALASMLAIACLGAPPAAQEPPAQKSNAKLDKLDKYVRDACGGHPQIRVQATRRLLRAGTRGLAACLRFVKANGTARLSADLVLGIGDFDLDNARGLLRRLVADPAFAWRPQALLALAKHPTASDAPLFESFLAHGSWLMRRGALEGWTATQGKGATAKLVAALHDDDLRVRVYAASLLLARKNPTGVVELIAGLDAEERFFGYDLAFSARKQAHQALTRWIDHPFGYSPWAKHKARAKAIVAFSQAARAKLGAETLADLPARLREVRRAPPKFVLGFERRSCRDGDLYLRIDEDGRLWRGLFHPREAPLSPELRSRVRKLAAAVRTDTRKVFGRLRCDFTRYAGLGIEHKLSIRCAPGKTPQLARDLRQAWLSLAPSPSPTSGTKK